MPLNPEKNREVEKWIKDVVDKTQIENIENEIEDLLSSIKDKDAETEESSSSSSETESFVLEKIKD